MLAVFLASFVVVLCCLWIFHGGKRHPNLPPGIRGWPIIGSLPSFSVPFLNQIENYRKQFGDVFMWKIGSRDIVFICDPKLIKKAFNNPHLLDRPHNFFTFDSWSYGKKTGLVNSNGPAWLEHRRFALRQLRDSGFGKSRVEEIIRMETELLIQDIQANYINVPTPVSSSLNMASMNAIWKLAADKRFEKGDKHLETFQESLLKITEQIQGLVTLLDLFPWMVSITPKFVLNLIGFGELQETWDYIKKYIRLVIDERKENLNPENPCGLIDSYLLEIKTLNNPGFQEESLLIMLGDLFIGGSETTSTTIRWALTYMAAYPEVQAKAQRELDAMIPSDRIPCLADKQILPFTDAITHEVLRISTIAPLGVFHAARENTELEGHFIPKDAVVVPFIYGCHMSPVYWKNPTEFQPERFLDSDGKLSAKNEAFMPFALGRRQCPGENLARSELFVIFSAILQKFWVELPPGDDPSTALKEEMIVFSKPPKGKIIFKIRK